MTKPTETTNPTAAVAQVIALQGRRLAKIEATLNRVEALLEATRPIEPPKES